MMDRRRAAIINEAKTWLNTPWQHNKAVKGVGVDCGQLPLEVYIACGFIGREAVDDYPIDWALHRGEERYLQIVERYCIQVKTPDPGDLVIFKYGRTFSHGAIVLHYPLVIHALRGEKAGVIYDHAQQADLKRRERVFYSHFAKIDGEVL
jgi:cell wall-associated NlpC family hydrolase